MKMYTFLATVTAALLSACGGGGGGSGGPAGIGQVSVLSSTFVAVAETVAVDWTNPGAPYAGVIVVRNVGAPPPGAPVNGTTYNVGDMLPGGGEVIASGDMANFDDAAPPPGDVHYCVIAYDAAFTYGVPQCVVEAGVPEISQTGDISVDLGTGVVTVNNQPTMLPLMGTAVYDNVLMTLTIDLTAQNDFPRLLNNLKVLVSNLNEGTVTGDGNFGGTPYVHYGLDALDLGASAVAQIVVDGVTGATDPITFDVEFLNHRMLYGDGRWDVGLIRIDASGTGINDAISSEPLGYNGAVDDSSFDDGVVSPDGKFVYVANRNQPAITVIDTTTGTASIGIDLTTGGPAIAFDATGSVGFTDSVDVSPDGQFLYTVLTEGDHPGSSDVQGARAATDVYLVKVNRATLVEDSRVQLVAADATFAKGKGFDMDSAGTVGAVCIKELGQVFMVDLTTMAIIDTDPLTAGDQPFDVSATSTDPRQVAVSPAGDTLYVAYAGFGTGALDVIDVGTGLITPLPLLSPTVDGQIGEFGFGQDGRLYYENPESSATEAALSIYTPSGGGSWVEVFSPSTGVNAYGMAFTEDGSRYYLFDASSKALHEFDATTDTIVPNEADGGLTIPGSEIDSGHASMVSPF